MNISDVAAEQRSALHPGLAESRACTGHEIDLSPPRDFGLIHISDPHLSRQFYREHLKSFKSLLRAILDSGCDHLVITGDIVSTGDEDDYYLAREILGNLDLLDSRRLTVVPGNHDIFGGPHRAADVVSFPRYIRSVDYQRHLHQFQRVFAETFQGVTSFGDQSVFPFIKRVGPFSIIGLNSIPPWSLQSNPFGTNGKLDEMQKGALVTMIGTPGRSNTIPVVAIHHHFNELQDNAPTATWWERIESNTMRMRGRRSTLRLFESLGVRYVLHGHVHRNEIYKKNSITVANGAGAVCDDPVKFLKYNEVRYLAGRDDIRTVVLPIPFQDPVQAVSRHRLHFPVPPLPVPSTAK